MYYAFYAAFFLALFSALGVGIILFLRKPGFRVLSAGLLKTKNSLPVLSLTLSFKGDPVSYINPMIYIKSVSGLYKATIFSGSGGNDSPFPDIMSGETPAEIKNEKILPYRLGVFTINIFYPTVMHKRNKTYLYVTKKQGKIKKFRLKFQIR